MKTTICRLVSAFCLSSLAPVTLAGAGVISQELAVVQAITRILAAESPQPYDYLFHESDFSARKYVAASMADPDRTQFCGLTRDQGMALIKEITFLNMEPVEFD